MTTAITIRITLDAAGAPPMAINVVPVGVRRDVVPTGIRYTIVVLDADIVIDPSLVRAIQIDDREDGYATEMRKHAPAWSELEFICQEPRPILDEMAARPA